MKNKLQNINLNASQNVKPEAYQSAPWWYDLRGFLILTFSYRDNLWRQVKFFSSNISQKHLEGAIGTGTLSLMIIIYKKLFLDQGPFHFIGVDYAPEMLKGAQKKLKGKNIVIEHGDLTQLNFSDNYFESINLANSFHTIKDIELALVEMKRVLNLNGRLRINVLIPPKTTFFLDRISDRINTWGKKKGILYRPYEIQEIIGLMKKNDFFIEWTMERGNAFYLSCLKKCPSKE